VWLCNTSQGTHSILKGIRRSLILHPIYSYWWGESNLKVSVVTPCTLSFTCIIIKLFRFQVQQPLPNNQDIQQSLEFMCTLHHIHVHHLLGQVIAVDP